MTAFVSQHQDTSIFKIVAWGYRSYLPGRFKKSWLIIAQMYK
jgi:hypothetical protein